MAQRRIGKLDTVGAIIGELGKVYKDLHRDRIDSLKAVRMASILSALRMTLEASDLENRIRELEKTVAETRG